MEWITDLGRFIVYVNTDPTVQGWKTVIGFGLLGLMLAGLFVYSAVELHKSKRKGTR